MKRQWYAGAADTNSTGNLCSFNMFPGVTGTHRAPGARTKGQGDIQLSEGARCGQLLQTKSCQQRGGSTCESRILLRCFVAGEGSARMGSLVL